MRGKELAYSREDSIADGSHIGSNDQRSDSGKKLQRMGEREGREDSRRGSSNDGEKVRRIVAIAVAAVVVVPYFLLQAIGTPA